MALPRLFASVGLVSQTFASGRNSEQHIDPSRPRYLILDVRMPGSSGLELQQQLTAAGYGLPVIFVTAHADVNLTVRVMKAGALEVFTKPFDDQRLLDAIHEALERDRVLRERLAQLHALRERYLTLTAREREVMALVTIGRSRTSRSPPSLEPRKRRSRPYRGQVMNKMRAGSLADLVRMADFLARTNGVMQASTGNVDPLLSQRRSMRDPALVAWIHRPRSTYSRAAIPDIDGPLPLERGRTSHAANCPTRRRTPVTPPGDALQPDEIVGESDALRYVMFRVDQVAPTDATVLLLRRNRHRQGAARASDSSAQRAARPPVRRRQLRGACRPR